MFQNKFYFSCLRIELLLFGIKRSWHEVTEEIKT